MRILTKLIQLGVFILLIMPVLCSAQQSREFWFALPDLDASTGESPVTLVLCAVDSNASVQIYTPADLSLLSTTANLSAGNCTTVDLTANLSEFEVPSNAISTAGVYIISSTKINAYIEWGASNQREIAVLKGKKALGKSFVVPFQRDWSNNLFMSPAPKSGFTVVATQNNTTVQITPTQNTSSGMASAVQTYTLNSGEAISIEASGNLDSEHMGGTIVKSSEEVAILTFDDNVSNIDYNLFVFDLQCDQLIADHHQGIEYLAVRGKLSTWLGTSRDMIYIYGILDNTNLTINGSNYSLNKGQSLSYTLSSNSAYITADNFISVIQVSGIGQKSGMAVVPPLSCQENTSNTVYRNWSDDLYLTMASLTTSGFKLSGNASTLSGTTWNNSNTSLKTAVTGNVKNNSSGVTTGSAASMSNSSGTAYQLGILHGSTSTGVGFGYCVDFFSISTEPIYHY